MDCSGGELDPLKGFGMRGFLDNNVYIFPDLDMVVVRLQSRRQAGVPEGTYDRAAMPILNALIKREK